MTPKNLLQLAMSLALSLAFVGCGGGESTEVETPPESKPSSQTELGDGTGTSGSAEVEGGANANENGGEGVVAADGAGANSPDGVKNDGEPGESGAGAGLASSRPSEPTEPKTAREFLVQAQRATLDRDIDKALGILEKGVSTFEGDASLLLPYAKLVHQKSIQVATADRSKANPLFYKAADAYRALQKTRGGEFAASEKSGAAVTFYNEGCAFATDGKPKEALAALKVAVGLGYNNFDEFKSDPDMASLLDNPEFKALIGDESKAPADNASPAKEKPEESNP